jgi:mannonate dehydratase
MKHTMRWFGPQDPVSLLDIRQAGCSGVVSALHQVSVGAIWTLEAIQERQLLIEAHNHLYTPLTWDVVESLPVHEDIKKGKSTRTQLIKNYQQSIRNLASAGIRTICYNFMPVLDWSRTNLTYKLPDGSETLRFVWEDFALFDVYILKRPNAAKYYDETILNNVAQRWRKISTQEIDQLTNTVLLGLPGSNEAFNLNTFQSLLQEYKDIGAEELRENLFYFIKAIAPVAEECEVQLCIHPDDPPYPLLGLPRVVSTENDLVTILEAYPYAGHGITLCTGSLGVRPENDLVAMTQRFASRIHFAHLRSVEREAGFLNFHEASHLEGTADLYAILSLLIAEEDRRKSQGDTQFEIPLRPDHGFKMLDDFQRTDTYPGYSAIGRLKGLAEIRGLELAIRKSLNY